MRAARAHARAGGGGGGPAPRHWHWQPRAPSPCPRVPAACLLVAANGPGWGHACMHAPPVVRVSGPVWALLISKYPSTGATRINCCSGDSDSEGARSRGRQTWVHVRASLFGCSLTFRWSLYLYLKHATVNWRCCYRYFLLMKVVRWRWWRGLQAAQTHRITSRLHSVSS